MNNETLDYEAAFDQPSCRSLLERLLSLHGPVGAALERRTLREPESTYRLVARAVALEQGFDSKCVAAVSNCTAAAVTYAPKALAHRLACGSVARRLGSGAAHPLAPVLERARAEAAAWRKDSNHIRCD